MMHDIDAAIQNLNSQLNMIAGVKSTTDLSPPGGKGVHIQIRPAGYSEIAKFGKKSSLYEYELVTFFSNSTASNKIGYLLGTIADKITEDRRRNGNAQTTVIEEWSMEEDAGRDGIVMSLPVTIRIEGDCS